MRHGWRVEEKSMGRLRGKRDTGTLVTSLSWSLVAMGLSDDRIAVGRRKALSVCQRGKRGVRIGQRTERGRMGESERRRADTIGEPRAARDK